MNSNRGFSLLEVMCAILILGFGLAGLTEGITLALGSNKEAEIQSAAALLAAGQLETLRAEGFITEGESEGDGEGGLSAYSWKQTVSETGTEGLYEVTVTVQRSGLDVYELKTLLFDLPITREEEPSARERENKRRRG